MNKHMSTVINAAFLIGENVEKCLDKPIKITSEMIISNHGNNRKDQRNHSNIICAIFTSVPTVTFTTVLS